MAAPTPETPTAAAQDDAYAAALGVPAAALAAADAEPSAEEGEVARAVRAYFAAIRPDPATFPTIATQILELVRYPDVDLNELAKLIRVDGALAGGILALANSAVYRAARKIDTVKDAVARLGLSEVARVSAAISMKSLYGPDAATTHHRFDPIFTRLFLHAATVARCASELARAEVAPTPGVEQVFLAGLLHDVGRAVALRCLDQLVGYGRVAAPEEPCTERVLQRVHVEVGVAMHRAWKLPPTLADVAAHHHAPAGAPEAARPCVHLVRLVSALDLIRRAPAAHPRAAAEAVESARALGLAPARLRALGAELETAEAWVRTVFPG